MYNFKIEKIYTKFGDIIEPKKINIIIGPNNCGKSRFLKDIRDMIMRNYNNTSSRVIVEKIDCLLPANAEEFIDHYLSNKRIVVETANGAFLKTYSGTTNGGIEVGQNNRIALDDDRIFLNMPWKEELKRVIDKLNKNDITKEDYEFSEIEFFNKYGRLFLMYLGNEEKLLLSKTQHRYKALDDKTNFLSEVSNDLLIVQSLSSYTLKLFNKDVCLDQSSWGDRLGFRVGEDFEFIKKAERNNNTAENKLLDYSLLENEGDGLRSFVTNFLCLRMSEKNILLLDEPEAFLHPPLARQLGRIIADSIANDRQLFLVTHSPDIIRGIVNEKDDVQIIRLSRHNDTTRVKIAGINLLEKIVKNSSLSTEMIIKGLFSERVYITESVADEEVYMALHDKTKPQDPASFIHGRNKQTLKDIAEIYDSLGVNYVRIYDFDILKDEDFSKAISKAVDQNTLNEYNQIKDSIKNDFGEDKEKYHKGGLNSISDQKLKQKATDMLQNLKKLDIIILPNGELETSLEDAGIQYTKNNKKNWLNEALDFIESRDPEEIKETQLYRTIFEDVEELK